MCYIRGLIHVIGRGGPNATFRRGQYGLKKVLFQETPSTLLFSKSILRVLLLIYKYIFLIYKKFFENKSLSTYQP